VREIYGWPDDDEVCAALTFLAVAGAGAARAELCTTQSQMKPAERDALAAAARTLAQKVQANDADGLKTLTISEYASNFGGIAYAVTKRLGEGQGGTPVVEQIYLLDATMLKKQPDGSTPDAQFFCSLNRRPWRRTRHPQSSAGQIRLREVDIHGAPAPYRLSSWSGKMQTVAARGLLSAAPGPPPDTTDSGTGRRPAT